MIVDIKLHHGGIFINEDTPEMDYVNCALEVIKNQDIDEISYFDFLSWVNNYGYTVENVEIWYAIPGKTLQHGRKRVHTDSDVVKLISYVEDSGIRTIDVFVEHMVEAQLEDNQNEDDAFNGIVEVEPVNYSTDMSPSDNDSGEIVPNIENFNALAGEEQFNGMEDGVLDDDEIPLSPRQSDEELDDEVKWDSQFTNDSGNVFSLGQTFKDAEEFKDAIRNYSVSSHRSVYFERSDTIRVSVKCSVENCPWRIWCSPEKRLHGFQIKSYEDKHTCEVSTKLSLCDSRWLAKKYLEKFRINNNYKARDLRAECLQNHGISVSISQCYRARQLALRKLQGNQHEHFAKIRSYENELRLTNKGSTIVVETDNFVPSKPVFQRMYIGFEALRKGWMNCCRPIIGLDGAFLKWFVKGELLSAVGRDANNQMFPIAWAVVEVENTDSWSWFIRLLISDLRLLTGEGLTLISDGQKGLLRAIKDYLPNAKHRLCARHVYANWRKKWRLSDLKPLFWAIARAYTVQELEKALNEMKKLSLDAALDIQRSNMEQWCRAYFTDDAACDVVHNNMSESFNASIRNARSKPIIGMLEDIRLLTMQRMASRIEKISKWEARITPKVQIDIETKLTRSLYATVIPNGRQKWEVRHEDDACVVDMERKTCSCRSWSLSGIPCYHSLAVMIRMNFDFVGYVSVFYSHQLWAKSYNEVLNPINGENMWVRTSDPDIQPPKYRKMPGRPKRNRTKDPAESPRKISRRGRIMTCKHCFEAVHNKSGCAKRKAGEPAVSEMHSQLTVKIGRPRTSQASSSTGRKPKGKPRTRMMPSDWNRPK